MYKKISTYVGALCIAALLSGLIPFELSANVCPCLGPPYPGPTLLKAAIPVQGGTVKEYCTNEAATGNFFYVWCPANPVLPPVTFGWCIFVGGKNELHYQYDECGNLEYIIQRNIDCGGDDGKPWDMVDSYVCVADGSTLQVCWEFINGQWVDRPLEARFTSGDFYASMSQEDANGDGLSDDAVAYAYAGMLPEHYEDATVLHSAYLSLEPVMRGNRADLVFQADNFEVTFQPGDYILLEEVTLDTNQQSGPQQSSIQPVEPEPGKTPMMKVVFHDEYTPQTGDVLASVILDENTPSSFKYSSVELGSVEYFRALFREYAAGNRPSLQEFRGGFLHSRERTEWRDFPGAIGMGGTVNLQLFGNMPYKATRNAHDINTGDLLSLSAIGSANEAYGVKFDLGNATGYHAEFTPFHLSAGATLISSIFGKVNYQRDDLAISRLTSTGAERAELSVHFSATMQAHTVRVEARNAQGDLVASWVPRSEQVELTGDIIVADSRWQCKLVSPDGLIWNSISFAKPISIMRDGSPVEDISQVSIIADNPDYLPTFVLNARVEVIGLPAFELRDVSLQFGEVGHFAYGLGDAQIFGRKPELHIAHMASGGNDGAGVVLNDALGARLGFTFMIDHEPQPGAQVDLHFLGTHSNDAVGPVAEVSAVVGVDVMDISASFAAIEAESFNVEVYDNERFVASAENRNGAVAQLAFVDLGTDAEWTAVTIRRSGSGVPSLILEYFFDQDIRLAGAASTVSGNLIVITPNVAEADVRSFVAAEIRGTDYPSFAIHDVTTTGRLASDVADNPYMQTLSTDFFTFNPVQPNPMRSTALFSFELREPAIVRLAVYDLLGKRVITLAHGEFTPGAHSFDWNGVDAQGVQALSGSYLGRLEVTSLRGAGRTVRTQEVIIHR